MPGIIRLIGGGNTTCHRHKKEGHGLTVHILIFQLVPMVRRVIRTNIMEFQRLKTPKGDWERVEVDWDAYRCPDDDHFLIPIPFMLYGFGWCEHCRTLWVAKI